MGVPDSGSGAIRYVNVSDLAGPEWRFLADHSADPRLSWTMISGRPRTALERRIRRPALARWRAAAEATGAARAGTEMPAALVSHLPLMATATETLRRIRCPGVPHIAFAFNFTDLPQGLRRRFLERSLSGIDEFVVFSRFEQALYVEELGLPPQKIRFLPWAMAAPVPGPHMPLSGSFTEGGYLCAIGGEGRDYALLAEVMATRPDLSMAVVARPYSIEGIDFPPNMEVYTNLPLAQTWKIAESSQGLVIPLRSETTACGHITMVGAQLLGLPLVVTRSRGVADYVQDGATAQVIPARDASALGTAIDRLATGGAEIAAMATAAQAQARQQSDLANWVQYFSDLADRLG